MEKKTYWKGVLSGILVVVLIFGGYKGLNKVGLLSKENLSTETKIDQIEKTLEKYYVEDINKEEMTEMMYRGLVAGVGDPYTSYFSAKELSQFMEETEGSFHGIGVEIMPDPSGQGTIVFAPIEGTPAEKAGILGNDKIMEIDGIDASGFTTSEVASKVKGEEGTTVKLSVYREKSKEILNFEMKRENIVVKSATHKMLSGNIGYLKLTGFKANSYNQFMESYTALQKDGMKGLIIDVRNNPGGLLTSVEEIADELVPKGTLVYTMDKAGNRKDSLSDEKQIEVPLVLLVNEYSASASEILAGAIQDMGVGSLVGTQTFGKGLVQGLFPMPDGSGLKITIQKYYTPNGICIQGTGIAPDYKVELPDEYKNQVVVPPEEDTQLLKAIEVIKTEQVK